MVVLEGNPELIEKLIWHHQKNGITYKEFYEEDLNNQITAVVFEPTIEKYFKKYKLI